MQGVFFRDTCEREASAAGVTGFVRNRSDGRVDAAFEGDRAAVDRMVAWCRHGPPRAVVEGIEVVDEDPKGDTSFHVTWWSEDGRVTTTLQYDVVPTQIATKE